MLPLPDAPRRDVASEPGVLAVQDVAREVAELKARGVTFETYDLPEMEFRDGIARGAGGTAAWFKDTEGNILALIQES